MTSVTIISPEGSQNIDIGITKDGNYLLPTPIELEESETPSVTGSAATSENVATPEEIATFVDCLKEADFKIYGANWCGWTNKLVTSFGGFDAVAPIYIECTENKELCDAAEVTGYPTIIIGGELFKGDRTFEAFAEATGCAAPSGEAAVSSKDNPDEGSC